MMKKFKASVWQEDDLYVAQCLEIDVASQGRTEAEALKNLKEAIELHLESPTASHAPKILSVEVDVSAA